MAEQNNADVLSVITQIVSEESGVAAKDITRDTTFAQDLDVDSLGLLTIATQVEERFGVALSSHQPHHNRTDSPGRARKSAVNRKRRMLRRR